MKRGLLSIAVLGLLVATNTWAGAIINRPTFIDWSAMRAGGGLASSYNANDVVQWVGCQLSGTPNYPMSVICSAHTATDGNTASCITNTPSLVATLQGLNSDSYVQFEWNTGGICTRIDVFTMSYFLPKKSW